MKALLISFTLLTLSYGANKIFDQAKVHKSPWQKDLHLILEDAEVAEVSDDDSTEESPRTKRHEIEPEEKLR